ncbi:MAG: tRNA pseudouridine(55) synthase TruB [Prosthecobacter sp.]|jgi:tRNA pseudouridine55 synthase|uniref:tRNA pseudouridine(55) synthase TruB n=1 Tax=Prosthecobacter sp. TaxID=1965333 RepID=UPI0019F6D84D|nr:tRNA pseudouridine(55) synthase TruB [Prosthecobacter sp.]MBE2287199.1 tRNA pseudouridine(55) synthase TruB [Prosthecobacter sp.]
MKSDELISGVLLVDKGQDMTSHDVVAVARRCLNMKKIGHCGTLDPMATGMLILVLGNGTRLSELLMSEDKEYVGTLTLGKTTNTQDAEGETVLERPVPADLTLDQVKAAFDSLRGDFYQTPPMVSAVKINGVPLYKLARKGQEVEREPRFVRVYDYEITRFAPPEVDFRVVCSKGFYVRTYANDIGEKLGCGGHLSALRRTRSGHFKLLPGKHVTFDMLKQGKRDEVLAAMLSLYDVSKLRGA